MKDKTKLAAFAIAGALTLAACGGAGAAATTTQPPEPVTTTTVETMDDDMTDETTDEMDDGMGEPTRFLIEIANVSSGFLARTADVFAIPVGADEPAPAFPGDSYAWTFAASPGERLSFATMLVQSNDWFFAPGAEGVALFDDAGNPLVGDITEQISLWDAGTEADQAPGVGEDQAPRQSGPDTGDVDPDTTVRMVEDRDVAEYVTVSLSHDGTEFTLTIENISEGAATPSPIAPGIGVLHNAGTPIFEERAAEGGYGLEALAEDGDPSRLVEWIISQSGVTTPFAPGVAIALDHGSTLFVAGSDDTGEGLEALAEDGDPGVLAASSGGTAFAVPSGATDPGPLFPGQSYTVEIDAAPGHYLTFATMFVQSNDWFFSLGEGGIELFGTDGSPISGDITDQVTLWDAGTEVNQISGIGSDQAPRQAGPNTGDTDPDSTIRIVEGYAPGSYIQITITPQG